MTAHCMMRLSIFGDKSTSYKSLVVRHGHRAVVGGALACSISKKPTKIAMTGAAGILPNSNSARHPSSEP